MNQDDINRIAPLSELDDFKVADGNPDIRGWDVMTQDGRTVGEVDELLVDTSAMKVRYMAIDLDDDVAGSDRKVLVPISAAQLDVDDQRVLVIGISAEQFATLPEYRREAFDRDYDKRQVQAGDVEVRKTVEMEEVGADLRRERIDVDEWGRTKSSRAAIDRAIDQGLGEADAR